MSRSKLVFLLLLGGLPILLCGGTPLWWLGRQLTASWRLEEKRAEIRARGLPIDDASMTEFRYQRMSHESSDRWMRVLEELQSERFKDSCVGIPIVGIPEDEERFFPGQPYKHDEDVRRFLETWSELTAEIHEVVEGNGAIWTEIEFDSINTMLPYAESSRWAGRMLLLEYQDAVRRDDRELGFHSLMAMIGVARSLEDEPVLISQLVQIAQSGLAMRCLKQSLELDLLSEEQMLEIFDQLKKLDDIGPRYRLAIAGERAMSQPLFDDSQRLGDESVQYIFGSRSIDALAALDFLERAESIESDDLELFFVQTQVLDDQLEQEIREASFLHAIDTMITGLTLPAIGAFGRVMARSAMEIRIAKIAIGLRLYQLRKGRWPTSLEQLSSAELETDLGPTEPVGDRPFGFRVVDQTAEIWGFEPEDVGDSTPNEPVESASFPEEEQEFWEYWNWRLNPGNG